MGTGIFVVRMDQIFHEKSHRPLAVIVGWREDRLGGGTFQYFLKVMFADGSFLGGLFYGFMLSTAKVDALLLEDLGLSQIPGGNFTDVFMPILPIFSFGDTDPPPFGALFQVLPGKNIAPFSEE